MASTFADGTVLLPSFPPDNTIELASVKDSKIIGVSVYSSRAEITRLFKFSVKPGLNQVVVLGLPTVLDKDSFRRAFVSFRLRGQAYSCIQQGRRAWHRDHP